MAAHALGMGMICSRRGNAPPTTRRSSVALMLISLVYQAEFSQPHPASFSWLLNLSATLKRRAGVTCYDSVDDCDANARSCHPERSEGSPQESRGIGWEHGSRMGQSIRTHPSG